MGYLKKVDEIVNILKEGKKAAFLRQFQNAKLAGGTGGETLAIICSLLKTYQIQMSESSDLVRQQVYQLYNYAESIGLNPETNFSLLEELDKTD